jgi:hypothetical protein
VIIIKKDDTLFMASSSTVAGNSASKPLTDISSSSDDGVPVRRVAGAPGRPPSAGRSRQPPAPAPTASSTTNNNNTGAKERELTDLLQRASHSIQQEREKVQRLVEENDTLRLEISSLRGQLATAGSAKSTAGRSPSTAAPDQTPNVFLKQRIHELALENHMAVERICELKLKVASLEASLGRGQNSAGAGGLRSPVRTDSSHKRPSNNRSRSAQPTPAANFATVTPTKYTSYAAQKFGPAGPPTPRHQENTVSSRNRQHASPPRPSHVDPIPCGNVPQPTVAITLSPQCPSKSTHQQHQQQHQQQPVLTIGSTPSTAASSSSAAAADRDYNEIMLTRLRRAMAPPPSKEQIGEVVHAMVCELQRQLLAHSNGAAKLLLKKLAPCVYYAEESKRKLHLTVCSSRLVVRSGGGYVDFLEYVERNKLCTTNVV